MKLEVIDPTTGKYPDLEHVALSEDWAKHLMYCDMEGFALAEDGYLILTDECGGMAYPPDGRFTFTLDIEASHARLVKALEAVMALDEPQRQMGYLLRGIGTATKNIAWLDADKALAEAKALTGEQTAPAIIPALDVDKLAQIIRRVDGTNSLGAGILAEKIIEALTGEAG